MKNEQRMTPAQVATKLEGYAEEYRITAQQEGDTRQGVKARAKAEAYADAAKLVREHLG